MSVTFHTSAGDIKIAVASSSDAPSRNFFALCAAGRYDGKEFHRAVSGLCVQGGGRKSRAAWCRRIADIPCAPGSFDKPGVVAFANKGTCAPDGVGSQFFITTHPASHLDTTCTLIGTVLWGLNNVVALQKIVLDPEQTRNPTINSVTIHANPFAN